MKPLIRSAEIDKRLLDTGLERADLEKSPVDSDVVSYFIAKWRAQGITQ